MPGGVAAAPGFFGKVASQGDFVASRFDLGLRRLIDDWLQRAIEHSRHRLGVGWEEAFQAMPVWRFVLTPGLLGQSGFAGLMMPSSDRVGRPFPLLLAARLAAAPSQLHEAAKLRQWFDVLERTVVAARQGGFDLARFDRAVAALALPPDGDGKVLNGRSYWWTFDNGVAQRFSSTGLPAPENFERFLGRPKPADRPAAAQGASPRAEGSAPQPRCATVTEEEERAFQTRIATSKEARPEPLQVPGAQRAGISAPPPLPLVPQPPSSLLQREREKPPGTASLLTAEEGSPDAGEGAVPPASSQNSSRHGPLSDSAEAEPELVPRWPDAGASQLTAPLASAEGLGEEAVAGPEIAALSRLSRRTDVERPSRAVPPRLTESAQEPVPAENFGAAGSTDARWGAERRRKAGFPPLLPGGEAVSASSPRSGPAGSIDAASGSETRTKPAVPPLLPEDVVASTVERELRPAPSLDQSTRLRDSAVAATGQLPPAAPLERHLGKVRSSGKPAGTPPLPIVHWGEPLLQLDPAVAAPLLFAASASRRGGALRGAAMALSDQRRCDLHVLARGSGDGVAGAQAAGVVLERLQRLAPATRIDDAIAEAKAALGNADILLRMLGQESRSTIEASVVALLAAGLQFAVLWAGDLRCYLLRDGLMRCLTRDHIEIGLQRRLARSVGGGAQFACDVVTDDLLVGDRFLLVAADVVKALGERRIAADLADSKPFDIPAAVLDEAMMSGARGDLAAIALVAR
ncbi:MAG: type VI secretion system-associated protein TagF [Alphaproteobacteria bacterium]|nr:type VI secretion system-associated protein TagF [Alphaproteobacteria bacterium]